MNTNTLQPLSTDEPNVADQAAHRANSAIRSTQNATNSAFDHLTDKVEDMRDQAAPLINRLSGQAKTAVRRGLDTMRDTSAQVRETALRTSDSTVGYIKDEPVKAILIAAAAGAALMALVSLLARTRSVH